MVSYLAIAVSALSLLVSGATFYYGRRLKAEASRAHLIAIRRGILDTLPDQAPDLRHMAERRVAR